jgi:hypothetical protein
MSAEGQATHRYLHEKEVQDRLSWCLKQAQTPAHEHVHLAPGNSVNFMVRGLPVYRVMLTQYWDKVDFVFPPSNEVEFRISSQGICIIFLFL